MIIAILAVIAIISVTVTIVLMKRLKAFKLQLEDNNRLLYFNLNDSLDTREKMVTCLHEIETIHTDVHALSSGLQIKLQKEEEKARRKRFPKPDEVLQITETIRDQMSINATLRSEQKIPIGGAIPDITENVMRTYPDISEDYIIHKCIAIIQDSVS
jgi:hypothetical protein